MPILFHLSFLQAFKPRENLLVPGTPPTCEPVSHHLCASSTIKGAHIHIFSLNQFFLFVLFPSLNSSRLYMCTPTEVQLCTPLINRRLVGALSRELSEAAATTSRLMEVLEQVQRKNCNQLHNALYKQMVALLQIQADQHLGFQQLWSRGLRMVARLEAVERSEDWSLELSQNLSQNLSLGHWAIIELNSCMETAYPIFQKFSKACARNELVCESLLDHTEVPPRGQPSWFLLRM